MNSPVWFEVEPVRLAKHDPSWHREFLGEAVRIKHALSSIVLAIDIGSTTVPGLIAKPIIDVLVAAPSSERPEESTILALSCIGYEFLGEDPRRSGRWKFAKNHPSRFNLSFVPAGGDLWINNLAVREYLKAHPNAAAVYAASKHAAVRDHGNDLSAYQDAKRAFVDDLREHARRWWDAQSRDSTRAWI